MSNKKIIITASVSLGALLMIAAFLTMNPNTQEEPVVLNDNRNLLESYAYDPYVRGRSENSVMQIVTWRQHISPWCKTECANLAIKGVKQAYPCGDDDKLYTCCLDAQYCQERSSIAKHYVCVKKHPDFWCYF